MVNRRFLLPVIVLASMGALGWQASSGAEKSLAIDASGSHVLIHVHKSGVFGFAGHDHEVFHGCTSHTV